MKKIITILSIVALVVMGAMITSCDKETQNPDGSFTYTTTLHIADGTKTIIEADGTHKFKAGDQIAVLYQYEGGGGAFKKAVSAELNADDIRPDGKAARFTVVLENPTRTGTVFFGYPAASLNPDGLGKTIDYSSLHSQEGTLEYIAENCDICLGDGSWAGGKLPSDVVMADCRPAIGKFTFKTGTDDNINDELTSVVISVRDGLTGNWTYTVTPPSGSSTFTSDPIYVALYQASYAPTVTITATTATDTYINANDITLGYHSYNSLYSGHIYAIDVTVKEAFRRASSATASDYGMVICNNGHLHPAKTAVTGNCTAVAVFAHISGDKRYAIALENAQQANWNTITNNGANKNKNCAVPGSWNVPVPAGASWVVATWDIYSAIFQNLGSTRYENGKYTYNSTSNDFLTTNVGGASLQGASTIYMSTSESDSSNGWAFGLWNWTGYGKSNNYNVRPVLVF